MDMCWKLDSSRNLRFAVFRLSTVTAFPTSPAEGRASRSCYAGGGAVHAGGNPSFPCLKDNYGVLLHDPDSDATAAIDAPEAAPVEAALS